MLKGVKESDYYIDNILNFEISIRIIEIIKLHELSSELFQILFIKNRFLFLIYILYSMFIVYIIIFPLLLINLMINIIKIIISKTNFDYMFLILLLGNICFIANTIYTDIKKIY